MVLIRQEEQRFLIALLYQEKAERLYDMFFVRSIWFNGSCRFLQDGKVALDMALCFGRDFKSYDLVKLLKIMPTDDI